MSNKKKNLIILVLIIMLLAAQKVPTGYFRAPSYQIARSPVRECVSAGVHKFKLQFLTVVPRPTSHILRNTYLYISRSTSNVPDSSRSDFLRPVARDERPRPSVSVVYDAEQAARLYRRIERLERAREIIKNPKGHRVAILGDKHGRAKALKELVLAASKGEIDGVVVLGDAFVRGGNNVGVFRAMLDRIYLDSQGRLEEYPGLFLKFGGRAVFCMGNHEALIVRIMLLDTYAASILKRYFHGRKHIKHYIDKIKERIREIQKAGGNVEELSQLQRAVNWLGNDSGAALLKELKSDGINPRRFAQAILERYTLFHYDDLGYLNVHGGFILDENGHPSLKAKDLAELDRQWKELQKAAKTDKNFFRDKSNPRRVADLLERARPLMGARMPGWFDRLVTRIDIAPQAREGLFKYLRDQGWDDDRIQKRWIDWLIKTNASADAGTAKDRKALDDLASKYGVKDFTVLPAPRVNRELADVFEDDADAIGVHFAHTPREVLLIGGIEFMNHDLTHAGDGYTLLTDKGFVYKEAGTRGETVILSRATLLSDIEGRIGAARALLDKMAPAPAAAALVGTVNRFAEEGV